MRGEKICSMQHILYVSDRRQTRRGRPLFFFFFRELFIWEILSDISVQGWGCCGRERTFRNDIKLKGRKDFFQTSVYSLSSRLVASFSWWWSARIVSLVWTLWLMISGVTGSPLDFCPPCHGGTPGAFSFSATASSPEVRLASRATEGLNISARKRPFVWGRLGYIVRGTVVARKKAINSTCNSRKLSQVVHQLVEQTESDILRVITSRLEVDCFAAYTDTFYYI